MKMLLVAEKEETREILSSYFRPRGFDLIHYRSPLKAMDNIDEIAAQVVVFSAEDFPRHWKPFVKLLRQTQSKERTAFILLSGERFSEQDAEKAQFLEVNGTVSEKFEEPGELRRIDELLTRYSNLTEGRSEHRYIPEPYDDLEFLFTHPSTYRVVTGRLTDLSPSGCSFDPDDPRTTTDLPPNAEIPRCSLNVDGEALIFGCRVVRNAERLALKFTQLDDEQRRKIIDFVDRRSERELQSALKKNAAG